MQTIESFLEQDIPMFLDGFEQTAESSRASVDEINSLLTHDYHKQVHSALHTGTFHAVPATDFPMVKTINIFQNINQPLIPPKIERPIIQNTPELVSKFPEEAEIEVTKEVEREVQKIIPEDKKSDPALDVKFLERNLGSTKKEDLVIYVQAIIALEEKNKQEAVSLFYSLAKKYPKNLALRIRLQDALLLPGQDIPLPKIYLSVKENHKHIEKKNIIVKPKLVDRKNILLPKETVVSVKPSTGLELYVQAVQAIKSHDKDTAVKLLTVLTNQSPNNIAFKLRLQEATRM